MIADYSSYLELLAAVYISMLLEVETLKKLWYPEDYYERIQETLKNVFPEEEGEGLLNDRILESSKSNAEIRNKRMRCRALFMLALTAILLVLIGYEATFDDKILLHESWYNAITISILTGTLICFFGDSLFDQWNTTAIAVLAIVIEIILLMIFPVVLPFSSLIESYYSIIVVSLVTLPVLWEIFSRWLFSSVYSGFLRNYVQKVRDEYDNALLALKLNDKKLMPRTYRRLISDSIYSSNSDKPLIDICIQGYLDIRDKKLNEISRYPNGFVIFTSWICYKLRRCFSFSRFRKTNEKKGVAAEVPGSFEGDLKVKDSPVVILNYQREYDEFLVERAKLKGRLNIKQFCQQHGYDSTAMVTWLKQRNQGK